MSDKIEFDTDVANRRILNKEEVEMYLSSAADTIRASERKILFFKYVRPFVHDVLKNWTRYRWTLQGFGMLRAYISQHLRLHVWNSSFAMRGVSFIHDHPWDFESTVVSGRLTNTTYQVEECTQSDLSLCMIRSPFIRSRIVCGAGSVNDPDQVKASGDRVWLISNPPVTYRTGDSYEQLAYEVHHTSYDDGTVTLVSRVLPAGASPDHANVFFKADDGWVSAEVRDADPDEVSAIVDRALFGF